MISTRGRYALRILIDLAENQKDGYITLREASERQEISERYLESIVKDLVREKYIEGLRGKGGGYRLAKSPDRINVYDILRLMEGTLAPVACLEEGSRACSRAGICRTLPLWEGLEKVTREYLNGFTVQDLMRKDPDGFDFVI